MEDISRSLFTGAIWTPDRRVRVFVSSTLAELAPERAAAREAIEGMHLTPVLFELGARPHPPRALYSAYLDQSDVFVGIYWERYGWVAPGATVSGLEDEYDLSSRHPRLLYVKEPAPDREDGLRTLLDRIEVTGTASYRRFTDPDELVRLIAEDLAVLLSERFGTVPAPGSPLHRCAVPVPLTPTIGRRRETAAVAGLLRRGTRLVTITGVGGVGKSRLAVTVALKRLAERRGEVYFIPLGSVADPRLLIATIAEHVGVRADVPDLLEALADQLREGDTVMVLDNVERLAAAATDLAALLERSPTLQLLVTSRHVLRLSGEHEFSLAPLDVPAPTESDVGTSDAVRLFVDRAAAARPGFALSARNERAVAELCRRLDGLPLALELAAARLKVLEPDELLDRIGMRLDLLTGGASDLPLRQRGLRATLDWSYDLLTPAEQTMFARLGVFVGGATLDAAEAVCGGDAVTDVLEVMASLLEKSLIVHTKPTAGPARFQMLHVVRAYAWERLAGSGEMQPLRARHARWLLGVVRSPDEATGGGDRWDILDVEIDNVRAVLSCALEERDLTAAAALARDLRSWWWIRGMGSEAVEWLEQAEAMASQLGPTSVERAWIALALGHLQTQTGRVEEGDGRLRTALELFTAHDEAEGVVTCRLAHASVLADLGRVGDAITIARETLEQGHQARRDDIIEWASSILGTFLVSAGQIEEARTAHEEAREAATRSGTELYLALAHHQLAIVELMADRPDECWRHLAVAAAIYRRSAHLEGVSYALEIAAAACLAEHDVEEAADAATVAQELRDKLRLPLWPVLRPLHDRWMAELRVATAEHGEPVETPAADPTDLLERLCEHHLASHR